MINLLQAAFTELLHDEAYYYFYSTRLALGYYDHPPLIAWLIRGGQLLFQHELGVRFFVVLLSVGMVLMLAKLVDVRNYFLFFTVFFSVFIFQVFGFIAIPDSPMLFFTVLFFYFFRNYLKNDSITHAALLSLAVAGLLYSKYLGVLVVFFTFAGNLKLVKRKTFWFAFFFSVLLMLPHLFWQVNNNYVSIYFHLVERNRDAVFDVMNIVNYLLGQVGMLNPLIAILLFYYAIKNKFKDDFQRTLRWNVVGILSVGFLLSFNSAVEANWTAIAYIPLFLMAYPIIEEKIKVHKTVYILGAISLLIVLFLRFYLVTDINLGKRQHVLQSEFHNWDTWAAKVEEIADNRPVIFPNSYQKASKYLFYTNNEAFSYNYLLYRKNQFDLASNEAILYGENTLFVYEAKQLWISGLGAFAIPEPDSVDILGRKWFYKNIEKYYSYNFVPIEIQLENNTFRAGTLAGIPIEIKNPLDTSFIFKQPGYETYLCAAFVQKGQVIKYDKVEDISGLWLDKAYNTVLMTRIPDEPGKYKLQVSIQSGWLPPGINSRIEEIVVIPAK